MALKDLLGLGIAASATLIILLSSWFTTIRSLRAVRYPRKRRKGESRPPSVEPLDAAATGGWDHRYFNRVTRDLEQLGFQRDSDFSLPRTQPSPGATAHFEYFRAFKHPENETIALALQTIYLNGLQTGGTLSGSSMPSMQFVSKLADGGYAITTNQFAPFFLQSKGSHQIVALRWPAPVSVLWQRHQQRLSDHEIAPADTNVAGTLVGQLPAASQKVPANATGKDELVFDDQTDSFRLAPNVARRAAWRSVVPWAYYFEPKRWAAVMAMSVGMGWLMLYLFANVWKVDWHRAFSVSMAGFAIGPWLSAHFRGFSVFWAWLVALLVQVAIPGVGNGVLFLWLATMMGCLGWLTFSNTRGNRLAIEAYQDWAADDGGGIEHPTSNVQRPTSK